MQLVARAAVLGPALAAAIAVRGGRQEPDALDGAQARGALQRVAAVEEIRASRVLCRIGSDGDLGSVTVRLHADNSRSIAFNGDVSGYESKVRCLGGEDPQCRNATAPREADSAEGCPPCPCREAAGELSGAYSRLVGKEIDARCDQGQAPRVLLLGLGCGELATHVARHCGGGVEVDAVELDGRLPALARLYFGLPKAVRVSVGDALPFVLDLRRAVEAGAGADQQRYDVVFVDCFAAGGETPEHCRSKDFLQAVHALVRSGGQVIQHLWHTDPAHADVPGQFAATLALYKSEFSCDGCRVSQRAVSGDSVDSLVTATLPSVAATAL